ncbi:anti-sigma factor [Paenibacillus thalictri]|uniref:Anti-sigma factor n=1 Tax=Paenibacillus thalictri TaxID=2527873 RepID=A0A4Q9DQ34_9BACL|nr:anti-sigma factor [Paenibacillus thalictri]TBL78526.1 hypothetical protein EYB31_13545 [Paenibacillus thalictri]
MSEEFKRKLKQYADGTLPEHEKDEIEREMEKMEAYQAYLDELMSADDSRTGEAGGLGAEDAAIAISAKATSSKEKSIIRRGKWKARFTSAATVLAILIVITIVSSIITGLFYGLGEPNRMTKYQDVITSTIAVTRPNVTIHPSGQGNAFFTMDSSGKLNKQVGDEQVVIGDFSMKFLLGVAAAPQVSWLDNGGSGQYTFYFPGIQSSSTAPGEANRLSGERTDGSEWVTLEKLPEGTVAEAYLSFDRLFTTDELLARLEHKNMQPLWFAADAGPDSWRRNEGIVAYPVGFPYWPVWHADDLKIDHYEEKKSGWFGKIVSKGGSYPALAAYGDGAKRNENFLKTLNLLQQYKSIANKAAPFTDIDGAAGYIRTNGVKLYGAVVTGPVKELLKLREETWIRNLRVGEVRLWNWRGR